MNPQIVKRYAAKMGEGVTAAEAEAEMVRVMQKVARSLAFIYKFGYHTLDDIEQQGVMYALDAIDDGSYDVDRPLENFLSVHVRNRLSNFRRDHGIRVEPPCHCCDPLNPPAFPCQKWLDWSVRNLTKQNIMRPLDISNISDDNEINMREGSEVVEDTVGAELRTLLDHELPVALRRDYLQMVGDQLIPKARRDRVREAVLDIIKKKGYLNDATETED